MNRGTEQIITGLVYDISNTIMRVGFACLKHLRSNSGACFDITSGSYKITQLRDW